MYVQKRLPIGLFAAIIATVAACQTVNAASGTWVPLGGGAFNWNDNANWTNPFPNGATQTADMAVDLTGNTTVNLNTGITIGALNIGDTNGTHTFSILPAGGSLTFNNGATSATITKGASTLAAFDEISAPIVLQNNLVVTNNSAYVAGGSSTGMLRLSGGISGVGFGIIKEGTGTLSLTGGALNTYTGATVVNQGTLVVQAANSIPDSSPIIINATGAGQVAVLRWGFGNAGVPDTIGSVTMGGTTATSQPILNISYNQTLTITGNVTYDATNNPLGAAMGVNTGGSPWSSGTISLGGGTRTFDIGDSSNAAVDMNFIHAITNGTMIKDGLGSIQFNNTNTLTNVWVKRGSATSVQPNQMSASVTIGDTTGSDDATVFMIRGGNTNVLVPGGNTGTALLQGQWGVGSGSVAMSGTITLGSGAGSPHDLTIQGVGNNLPTYTGNISGHGNLIIDSGAGGTNQRFYQASIDHAGSITFVGNTGSAEITAVIGPNVTGLIKSNANQTTLGGANTFSGPTTVTAGTLRLNNVDALQNSTLDVGPSGSQQVQFVVAGTNTYNLGGLQGADALAIGGNSLSVGNNDNDTTYAGILSSTGGGLTKVGTGTLTLSNNNTYTGPTNVDAGTLLINGSPTGTALYTVASGGTLGGSGVINAPVSLQTGATLSTGSEAIGSFATGNQTWSGGGNQLLEINDAAGTPGGNPGWDQLIVNGTLDMSAVTSADPFNVLLTSLNSSNVPGDIDNFNPANDYAWMFVDATNPIVGFTGSDQFFVDATAFTNAFGGTFSVVLGDQVAGGLGDNSQLWLNYAGFSNTVVPEPASVLSWLAAAAVAAMFIYRGSRQRR